MRTYSFSDCIRAQPFLRPVATKRHIGTRRGGYCVLKIQTCLLLVSGLYRRPTAKVLFPGFEGNGLVARTLRWIALAHTLGLDVEGIGA